MSYPGAIYPGTSYPAWAPVAPGQMRTRLVSYTPFGPAGSVLPDALESQIVTPLGELPTAQVHYHRDGVNAVQLDGMTELGFEYYSTLGWVEPPNGRFLSMKGGFDHLEATPTRKYSFVGVGWMLRQAKVWEANGLQVDADGKVQFLSANAGQIMATLIANAQGRGWGAGVSIDFDSTADSSGQAWAKIITIAYDLDLDLETVLTNLYQQGVCDYRWEGRTLRIFNPETTMAADLTVGASPVRLVVNDGQTSAPEEWTNEDLLTHAMVLGEDGKRWEFANGANSALGRLEKVITQGGVSDEGTASLLAQTDLLAGSETQISFTREFVVTDESVVWPYRTYTLGDWVLAQRGTTFERLRTVSLSLTVNADGVKGHAVLGTRLQDLLTKLAKRTKGITGGASAGGSGARPAPEGPDLRTPDAPAGLVVQVDVYLDNAGFQQGLVNLDWAHTGTATDGTVMDVSESEVYYRVNEQGQLWRRLLTVDGNATEATQSGLPIFKADGVTPEGYGFKVRAVGGNRRTSTFSNIVAVTMAKDTTAPPVPLFTAGDVSTWLRTVKVTFDGASGVGASMGLDYEYANVYQGSSPSMAGAVVVGEITGDSFWQSGSMPLATVWYALTAVDRAGNESDYSAVQSVTPAANVDVAEIVGTIDAATTQLVNVGEESILTGSVIARHVAASEEMSAKLGQFLHVSTNMLDANAVTSDKADIGSLVTEITTTNALRSKLVIGPDVRTTDSPAITGGMQFYSGGLKGWDSNGRQTLGFSPVTGKLFTEGDISTGPSGRRAEMYDYGSYAGFRSWATGDSDSYMELFHSGTNPHQTRLNNVEDGTVDASLVLTGMSSLASSLRSRAISLIADDYIDLNGGTAGKTRIYSGARQDGMEFGSNSFGEYVSSGTVRATSTTQSPNMFISSSGQMYHTTSTAATKAAIAPAPDITEKLLGVGVRTWFDMGQSEAVAEWTDRTNKGLPCVDEDGKPLFDAPDKLRPVWGVVAEELANAGLGEFLHYHGDGSPAGVMYDRLAVALIPIIRWQHGQIQGIQQDIQWLKSFHTTYEKGL